MNHWGVKNRQPRKQCHWPDNGVKVFKSLLTENGERKGLSIVLFSNFFFLDRKICHDQSTLWTKQLSFSAMLLPSACPTEADGDNGPERSVRAKLLCNALAKKMSYSDIWEGLQGNIQLTSVLPIMYVLWSNPFKMLFRNLFRNTCIL